MTATAGLYARAALPGLPDPITAYPMLAEAVLPPIAKGLFYVGMLATIMSTLNTLAFVSAQTLGRDILMRLRVRSPGNELNTVDPNRRNAASTRYTQIGLIMSILLSIALALLIPSVITLWYTIGTIIIPGLLVPLIASYFEGLKISPRYAFLSMLLGWLTSVGWLTAGYLDGNEGSYPLGIQPMYPGLLVSVGLWAMGRMSMRGTTAAG
jgi:SSS family solute:Na+ symporter